FRDVDGVSAPQSAPHSRSVYHLYVIRVDGREALQKQLAAKGIGTGIHYPVPLHLQAAYKHLGYGKRSFSVSEQVASEILSLPLFPQIADQQIQTLVIEIAASLPLP